MQSNQAPHDVKIHLKDVSASSAKKFISIEVFKCTLSENQSKKVVRELYPQGDSLECLGRFVAIDSPCQAQNCSD